MVIPNEPLLTRTCLLLLPSHSTSYRRPLANVMSLSWPRGTAILVFEEIDNSFHKAALRGVELGTAKCHSTARRPETFTLITGFMRHGLYPAACACSRHGSRVPLALLAGLPRRKVACRGAAHLVRGPGYHPCPS